jgi:hypothetical protein
MFLQNGWSRAMTHHHSPGWWVMAKMLGRQCIWMMKMIIQGKVESLCHILYKYHNVLIQHFFILLILISWLVGHDPP